MASCVMRFALATYFMKRGSCPRLSRSPCLSPWSSASYEPSIVSGDEDEEPEERGSQFSEVVSSLRQLLVEQRFTEWSSGIAGLREYVTANELLGPLVAELVEMLIDQEQDAVCVVQVIADMCFMDSGEPSTAFDQLVEFLFEALDLCCQDKTTAGVAIWLQRALDGIKLGLRQYHDQRFGMAGELELEVRSLEDALNDNIRDYLSRARANTPATTAEEG